MSNSTKLLVFGLGAYVLAVPMAAFGLLLSVIVLMLGYQRWAAPGPTRRQLLGAALGVALVTSGAWIVMIFRSSEPDSGFGLLLVPHIIAAITLLIFSTLAAQRELRLSGKSGVYPIVLLGLAIMATIGVIVFG